MLSRRVHGGAIFQLCSCKGLGCADLGASEKERSGRNGMQGIRRHETYLSLQEALVANGLDVQKALEWLIQKGRSAKGKVRFLLFSAN